MPPDRTTALSLTVHRRLLARLTLGLGLLAAVAVAACAARNDEGLDRPDPLQESKQSAGCAHAVRYHAFLASGECIDAPGAGGTWVANATFPNAPSTASSSACSYVWAPDSSDERLPPDVDVLRKLDARGLTKEPANASCAAAYDGIPPQLPVVPNIPDGSDKVGPSGGVTGCDVCGHLDGDELFVILPEDGIGLDWSIEIESDSATHSFDIVEARANVQVFSVKLPLIPNVRYRPETVRLVAPL